MKLIDLLVRELPKRGGWPSGAEAVVQDADDMEFYFYTGGPVVNTGKSWWFKDHADCSRWIFYEGKFEVADDHDTSIVTRAQYQSALAASQNVEWSGDGLPPVGVKCEIIINEGNLGLCEIIFVGQSLLVWRQDSTYQEGSGYHRHMKFLPLRSEADKKRDAACRVISDIIDENRDFQFDAKKIYDAIAAGKIPGVKLED